MRGSAVRYFAVALIASMGGSYLVAWVLLRNMDVEALWPDDGLWRLS